MKEFISQKFMKFLAIATNTMFLLALLSIFLGVVIETCCNTFN